MALSVDDALRLADQYQRSGDLQRCELLLNEVLEREPEQPQALHMLGILAHRCGQTKLAVQLLDRAIAQRGDVSAFYSNRAEMARCLGDTDAALQFVQRAIDLDPTSPLAYCNLGIIHYDRGELDSAEPAHASALAINPRLPQSLNNLGSIARARGERDRAMDYFKQALAAAPAFLEAKNNLAALLIEEHRPERALSLLDEVLSASAGYLEAQCNRAHALLALEQFDAAAQAYRQVLKTDPRSIEAARGLIRVSVRLGRLRQASKEIAHLLGSGHTDVETLVLAGHIFSQNGETESARNAFERALVQQAAHAGALLGMGQLQLSLGQNADCVDYCQRVLQQDASNLDAHLMLIQAAPVEQGNASFTTLEKLCKHAGSGDAVRQTAAQFALGKGLQDQGRYREAFSHFVRGNRLKRERIHYDGTRHGHACQAIRSTFSKEFIAGLRDNYTGNSSDTPIFIVGMPRSGSTLVEQILASHPDVYGAGELMELSDLVNEHSGTAGYAASVGRWSTDVFDSVAGNYVSALLDRSDGAARVTDKMPSNLFFLGLIHVLFPRAKIIHVKRDPVATCLSLYTQLFRNDMPFSYDLTDLAQYYSEYAKMMSHWRAVLPEGAFYELDYETLVADQSASSRSLIEYCQLEWDERCIEFHQTQRIINTASFSQVRRPMYATSVDRWKHYADYLGPLTDALAKD